MRQASKCKEAMGSINTLEQDRFPTDVQKASVNANLVEMNDAMNTASHERCCC